jgi:hypothetical protein
MQCSQCGKLSKSLIKVGEYRHLCKGCKEMLDNPRNVMAFNRLCKQTTGMCACCGLSAGSSGENGWFVYSAGWADSDGVFYPRLCGNPDDYVGCIFEVEPKSKKEVEDDLKSVYGDDLDALAIDLEDFGSNLSDFE